MCRALDQAKIILKLEGVQTFSARFFTRQGHVGSDSLQNDLHWPFHSCSLLFPKIMLVQMDPLLTIAPFIIFIFSLSLVIVRHANS